MSGSSFDQLDVRMTPAELSPQQERAAAVAAADWCDREGHGADELRELLEMLGLKPSQPRPVNTRSAVGRR